MWKPKLKTWADKFFWIVVSAAILAIVGGGGRIVWVIAGLNIEKWAESQGIDDTLVNIWPPMMSWALENCIWLYMIFSFLLGAAISLSIYRKLVPLDRPNFRDPVKIRRIGAECSDLSQEMLRFLERRAHENSNRRQQVRDSGSVSDSRDTWEADRDFEAVTSSQFFAQFGQRALRTMALLRQAGIAMPTHVVLTAQHSRPHGLVQILSVFGEYLRNGELEEAIDLSNNRDFMWQIQH